MEESTHIYFDGSQILISPDISPVFRFLIEIQTEIDHILKFNEQLQEAGRDYKDLLKLIQFLTGMLREHNIEYEYRFERDPKLIADALKPIFPIRAQMIVLFASLEVLFTLHMAYELHTSDTNDLRQATLDVQNTKEFINNFILTKENSYYRENSDRLKKIDSRKFRELRNSLTHFFSVGPGGLSISPDVFTKSSRKLEADLERNKHGHIVFFSEADLYGLIKAANFLRLKKWSNDFMADSALFKSSMTHVKELVAREAAVIVHKQELDQIKFPK